MPELPDVTAYIENLQRLLRSNRLTLIRLFNPFLLRTAVPPVSHAHGRKVVEVSRIGKRIVISLEGDMHLVLHLMIAGRLHWPGKKTRNTLALFEFENGTLSLTEAGTRRRASLHLVQGEAALRALDPGGIEIFDADLKSFCDKLLSENHTLKRALTDPRLFAGIGNAYSDEILHRARLSPMKLTSKLTEDEIATLHRATVSTLQEWIDRLRADADLDSLTGLANRRRFRVALTREVERWRRYRIPCALLMLDIDHLKSVNDKFGHPVGDMVIRQIAQTLKEVSRDNDTAARLGGEEFAVYLPETGIEGAHATAERVQEAVSGLDVQSENHSFQLTISIGATEILSNETFEAALHRARLLVG